VRQKVVRVPADDIVARLRLTLVSPLVRTYQAAIRSRETRLLVVLLAVALVVQVVYFVRIQSLYPSYGLTTEHFYSPLALNLLNHGVYGSGEFPDIEETTKRPPFYSLVLAGAYGLFGEDEVVGLLISNLFLWLTIIVVYLIGRKLSPVVGLIAALLFVMDPIGVINANKNQAGTLYGLLIALFFLVSIQTFTPTVTLRRTLVSSLLLGLATLTRASSLYLGFPLALAFFAVHRWVIRRFSLSRIMVLTLALFSVQALIVGGWMVRNNLVSGNSEFATMSSIHLYNYYVPLVIAKKEGIGYEEARVNLADELQSDPEYLAIDPGPDRQSYIISKSVRLILENPVQASLVLLEQAPLVFLNYPQNAASLFLSDERRESLETYLSDYVGNKSSRLDISGYPELAKHYVSGGYGLLLLHGIFYKLFYFLFMLGGAAGVVLLLRRRETRAQGIFFFVAIAYTLLIFSTWPSGRLRMGILPFYSVAAAYCAVWFWNLSLSRRTTATLLRLPASIIAKVTPRRGDAQDVVSEYDRSA
jgi:4-amino-4-deoxy-L-arabinose transferase-like glycosyltransferase